MEDTYAYSAIRKWEDMDIDILVKIFQNLDIFELTSGVAHVCHTWRMAACDPLIWRSPDLSLLKSNFIKIPFEPYVYVESRSDKIFTRVMKIALNLSRGNIATLVFHYSMYISDDQLTYTAERCPRLRRLVMPAWNRITKEGVCRAFGMWEDLESLTMQSISNPQYLMEEISRSCRKFAELKVMGPCDIYFASTIAAYLPNLKVLSLRCSTVFKDALIIILECLPGLEVLNIAHCVGPPPQRRVVELLDKSMVERARRLKKLVTCMRERCRMCELTKEDEGLIRWYKYGEHLWREDEVTSLAV